MLRKIVKYEKRRIGISVTYLRPDLLIMHYTLHLSIVVDSPDLVDNVECTKTPIVRKKIGILIEINKGDTS